MNSLEGHGVRGHDEGAGGKPDDAPGGGQRLEERIGIPAVVAVALLDPEPVRERNGAAEQRGARERDGPRRRQEQEVEGQHDGGDEVESEV